MNLHLISHCSLSNSKPKGKSREGLFYSTEKKKPIKMLSSSSQDISPELSAWKCPFILLEYLPFTHSFLLLGSLAEYVDFLWHLQKLQKPVVSLCLLFWRIEGGVLKDGQDQTIVAIGKYLTTSFSAGESLPVSVGKQSHQGSYDPPETPDLACD